MRRFEVWIAYPFAGAEPEKEIIEFPDSATDDECAEACAECLETMIGNHLDTGWGELK